jgi:hypothetical protein
VSAPTLMVCRATTRSAINNNTLRTEQNNRRARRLIAPGQNLIVCGPR